MLWTTEIARDLSLKWVSDGRISHITQPLRPQQFHDQRSTDFMRTRYKRAECLYQSLSLSGELVYYSFTTFKFVQTQLMISKK